MSCARIVSGEERTVPSFTVSEGVLTVVIFPRVLPCNSSIDTTNNTFVVFIFSNVFIKLRGLSHV